MNEEKTQKGIFISIDGSDGSGKTTQIEILVKKLRNFGYEVETISFPQYGNKSAGIVEEYLNGKYGHADDVGPYASSIFYATDRFDAKKKIEKWLNEGKIVISDRYVSANMGHQGAKINDRAEREEFYDWLCNLEYDVFRIPRPNISMLLNVDPKISLGLLEKMIRKEYLEKDNKDIHESDPNHLQKANKVFKEIAEKFDNFEIINCSPENKLLSVEEISSLVWDRIIPHIKTKDKLYAPDFKNLHANQAKDEKYSLKVEKVFDNAKLPTKGYLHDAGFDLYSAETKTIYPGERSIVRTGIKIALPVGYAGLIWDKSGIAKSGLNTMGGVIDAGFRGEITINIYNTSKDIYTIETGQKIAQIIIQKIESPIIEESKIDDDTDRGSKSYGSTGLY
ncbi:dUTP diphosphatase [Candidatus Parcubacteria bacterium]|nr:MAG: dUTP diphosphatase [Candidatus Parcubacteria bacterium]